MSALGNPGTKDVIVFGQFKLFAAERLLKKDDVSLPLGGRALDLLKALLQRPGEVVSREELMEQAWPDVTVAESNLRVQIGAIRKVLGDGRDGARYIANVAGRGYSFVATVHRPTPLALNGSSEQWSREQPRVTFRGSFQWSCQTYGYQKAGLSDANRH